MSRQKFLIGLIVSAILTFGAYPALAVITYPVDLGTSNLGAGFPGPYATLNVTLVGQVATITLTGDTSGGFRYLMTDGSSLALSVNSTSFTNGTITATNIDGGSITESVTNPPGTSNVNGFGRFNFVLDAPNANLSNSATSISFTLTNTSATLWATASDVLTPNDTTHNAIAAAHIGACPVTCADGSSFSVTGFAATSGGTVPPTEVPEPSTLLLLGSGLVGLSLFSRYQLRRH